MRPRITGYLIIFLLCRTLWPQIEGGPADLTRRASQAEAAGRLDEAAELLRRLLSVQPENREAGRFLVDVLMRLTRWDEAREQVHLLRLRFPSDHQIRYLAAAVAFRTGDFEGASALARQSLEQGDQRSEVYKLLGLSRYMLQDAAGFEENMLRAVEQDPRDAEAHYHLGRFYFENKNYRSAAQEFERVLESQPDHYRALYFLGLCEKGAGRLEQAEARFRASIQTVEKLKIEYGWPFSDLGELLVNQGQVEVGLSWLYRATRNDPNLPYTHVKYAGALLKQELTPEIEIELLTAIRLDPNYQEAHYLLGRYYSRAGDKEKAKAAFDRFQEIQANPQPSPFGIQR